MAAEDQPNPMEEFLRQFGITPGPDGTFDLNQLMGPLQQAMQQFSRQMSAAGTGTGDGLNWTLIKDIARKVTASSGPDPSPAASEAVAIRDTVGLAELWLDEHTSFGRTSASAATWSRAEWVEATIGTWEQLAGSVSNSLAAAVGSLLQRAEPEAAAMVQMMEPMMRMAAAGMLSAQVGQGILEEGHGLDVIARGARRVEQAGQECDNGGHVGLYGHRGPPTVGEYSVLHCKPSSPARKRRGSPAPTSRTGGRTVGW